MVDNFSAGHSRVAVMRPARKYMITVQIIKKEGVSKVQTPSCLLYLYLKVDKKDITVAAPAYRQAG